MAINIFEGARRIAMLTAAVATIGTLFALLTSDPYVSAGYAIAHPNGPFTRTDISCPNDARMHYFTAETPNGNHVGINPKVKTHDISAQSAW